MSLRPKKSKRRIDIRLDMTPMVDIAFLLLIFYMISTQFKPPEARAVELPESHSMIELPDRNVIYVTVTADDSVFVDFVETAEEGAGSISRHVIRTDQHLVAHKINRIRAIYPDAPVVLKADKAARFGFMEQVMNSMKENHVERFLIITELEKDI